MSERVEFEMTQEDLDKLLEAMKPVPMIMLQIPYRSNPQENANRAWAELGSRMGFEPMSVEPSHKGDRFFTAIACEPTVKPIAIVQPTCEELFEEVGFTEVQRETESGWRHGTDETRVFRRKSDGTFWQVCYRVSTDGETNELREGTAEIGQVKPRQVTVTEYHAIKTS